MSQIISIEQASARLNELVHGLGPEDEIVLTDANNHPIARIISNAARPRRAAGAWMEMLTVVKEDDGHLEDFKDYLP